MRLAILVATIVLSGCTQPDYTRVIDDHYCHPPRSETDAARCAEQRWQDKQSRKS